MMCKGPYISKDLYLQILVLQEMHVNAKIYLNFVELYGAYNKDQCPGEITIHTKLSNKDTEIHTLVQAVA